MVEGGEKGEKKAYKAFSSARLHAQKEVRTWKRNRNKAPVMSHLIFNLRRICRIALPRLLFFSLQWNCWTLFVDLNFPVHAGIHARMRGVRKGGKGVVRAVVDIAGRCGAHKASHHFSETKENRRRGSKNARARDSEGKKKLRLPRGVKFPARRHFIPLLSVVFFFPHDSFCFSARPLSNPRIWIYCPLSSHVPSFRFDEKSFLRALFHIRSSILIVWLSSAHIKFNLI